MTVSALVRVLVESFLPDMRQKYVIQNLKASEWYRQYKSFVPDFLRGRPRSLIIHCLERQARAKKFDETSVISNPQSGIFTIMKQSNGSHTVNFGVNSSEPSCTCKDWKKWNIPCKHFFAVFSVKAEWGWNALPSSYLQSAYLSCDTDTVTSFYKEFGEEAEYTESQSTDQTETELKEFEPSESITESPISQLPPTDPESTTPLQSNWESEALVLMTGEINTDSNHLVNTTQQNDENLTDEIPKKKVRNNM